MRTYAKIQAIFLNMPLINATYNRVVGAFVDNFTAENNAKSG